MHVGGTFFRVRTREGRFGKIFQRDVEGQIYAQPLYVGGLAIPGKEIHNVVFIATPLSSRKRNAG
jgi:hypothetical protein